MPRRPISLPQALTVFGREAAGCLTTSPACVFILAFPVLAGILTFYAGDFRKGGYADLHSFFAFHPWVYLVLAPAFAVGQWTAPHKFWAAWCAAGIALAMTFPFWLTVNVLGEPDNSAILASYLASWLAAGAMLAIGAAVAAAGNRLVAFPVAAALLAALSVADTPAVLGLFRGWAPEWLIGAVAAAGIVGHFTALTRGVIEPRDLVYFLSLIIGFLGIGTILAGRGLRGAAADRALGRGTFDASRMRATGAIICVALMLVAVNVIASHSPPLRLDLTAERQYTLSRATRLTLARIDEPVTLRFYYSARLGQAIPAYRTHARRVREVLGEYAAAADGKLRLEIHRPPPYSEAEQRAVAFGLRGVLLDPRAAPAFFGLAGTNSTDDRRVIPFFAPSREAFLEDDLTRLVHALAYPIRIGVGVLGEPIEGSTRRSAMLGELRRFFDVAMLPAALHTVPASTRVLMLAEPRELSGRTLFAIDQFVLRGGRAIVFIDPFSGPEGGGRPEGAADSNLARLFRAWGIRVLPGSGAESIDDPRHDLRRDALNRNDPITANLRRLMLASAGIIEPLVDAATTIEPLVTTPRFRGAGRHVLAARVTGPVETAYPDFNPVTDVAMEVRRRSQEPADLVIVADSDMLEDRLWTRPEDVFGRPMLVPGANNADFVANAIEALAGEAPAHGPPLAELRGRGVAARPFIAVDASAAGDRNAAERLDAILAIVNIALVPAAFAAAAIVAAMLRLRRRRAAPG